MSETNNTEQLRNWLRECPAIKKANRFRVDYLADEPTEYALIAVPSSLMTHENILGEEILNDIQTQDYIFAAKAFYSDDIIQNLNNLFFFQEVTEWIVEQNNAGNFPEWSGGYVKSILPSLTGYPMQVGTSSARYQIQIKITYRRVEDNG